MKFEVVQNADLKLLSELFVLSGQNCHLNPEIILAHFAEYSSLVVFIVYRSSNKIAFGIAKECGYWYARRLVFDVLPFFTKASKEVENCFWSGLAEYCIKKWILQLDLNAFNSTPIEIPNLGTIDSYIERSEFIVNLKEASMKGEKILSNNHRRNIRKANRAGFSFHIKNSYESCEDHARLVNQSMIRRRKLGELVDFGIFPEKWLPYIQNQSGFFMQAVIDSNCVSSILILKSSLQAYYASGGTSPEGMKIGAAHFLIWEAIQYLTKAGVEILNLGGVTEYDSIGLERFKVGFGAEPKKLPHRKYIVGSKWRNKSINALRLFRNPLARLF